MKEFYFEWPSDLYLLHLEMTSNCKMVDYELGRMIESEKILTRHTISTINGSYRFIVSRKSLHEKSILIKYSDNVVLKAFLVYDRAFYPTTPFFEK